MGDGDYPEDWQEQGWCCRDCAAAAWYSMSEDLRRELTPLGLTPASWPPPVPPRPRRIGEAPVHALAIAVLLLLPLLVWVPLWLGDVDREPSNEITQEQPADGDDARMAA